MIGVTIHQRKPRSEQQYITLSHGDESQYITPDGIQIVITNTTGKPLYLKWRI